MDCINTTYFIGLSIGVHLLSLLTIPAIIGIIHYFKNHQYTHKGFLNIWFHPLFYCLFKESFYT